TLSIDNVSQSEGNSGTTNYVFAVTQSAASGLDTTVVFSTSDGAAVAGSDYTSSTGTVTVLAGSTTSAVTVATSGDSHVVANDTFTDSLSTPSNATSSSETGIVTLQNELTAPTLSIDNVSQSEGNSSVSSLVFTVAQSAASGLDITVAFSTAD